MNEKKRVDLGNLSCYSASGLLDGNINRLHTLSVGIQLEKLQSEWKRREDMLIVGRLFSHDQMIL